MKVRTMADVAAEIARADLTRAALASQMGYTESGFSSVLKDRDGQPSSTFVAQFEDAVEVLKGGHPV
jgi:hypothetical protein